MPSSSSSSANASSAQSAAASANSAATNISQTYAHFIGKQFQLSKHSVYVEEVIAEGGFSIVFLVKSNLNGRKYALKRMYVNNESDLESCKLEIQIIKSLSEHNKKILRYVDSSIQRVHASDDIYEILLLTKYCRLGGLVQLMNERLNAAAAANAAAAQQAQPRPLLAESEIVKIFCDICEALADLHARGIIHRDLKIENILIDDTPDLDANLNDKQFKQQQRKMSAGAPSYNYVLCDFGSATNKVFDRRAQTYSSHMVQQVADEIQKYTTLSYRSPEMVDLYSNKPITVKSDIWALGCLLYKMCFSQMPFGDSLLAIQEGRYTIPDAKANFYSRQILSLINYTLEPDPLKRPDIFQVSCLAFQLAKRSCPIKNFDNSEAPPDINALPTPLTESEWRKVSTLSSSNFAQQQKNAATSTKAPSEVVTTVNPRERPKANINAGSSLLANPITSSSASANNAAAVKHRAQSSSTANQNKLSISIKPPPPPSAHQQASHAAAAGGGQASAQTSELTSQLHQLGFDDDFGSANSNTLVSSAATTPLVHQPIQPTVNYTPQPPPSTPGASMTHSVSHNNQLYRQQQQYAVAAANMGAAAAVTPGASALDKKSHHRRSASHSSTILLNPQLTPQQQQANQYYQQQYAASARVDTSYMNPLTPRLPAPVYDPIQVQQQQLKFQLLQLQHQQQLQQQQQQQQQQQYYYQNPNTLYPNMVTANAAAAAAHAAAAAAAAGMNNNNNIMRNIHHQHSRSTSTSPNASHSAAAQRLLSSTSAEVMEVSKKRGGESSSAKRNHQHQHHHAHSQQSHVNMSYNPFGDCFASSSSSSASTAAAAAGATVATAAAASSSSSQQINDNELFGLEFDRIRHQSVTNASALPVGADSQQAYYSPSSDLIAAATSKIHAAEAAAVAAARVDDSLKSAKALSSSAQHVEQAPASSDKKLARSQLSSSASSNSSSTSFSQSSSLFELRKLSSGSSTSSSSTKSPSPSSAAATAHHHKSKSAGKAKGKLKPKRDHNRFASNYVFDDDPFRSAPFKHQQPGAAVDRQSNNSSSHSSTSMATITNRSTTKTKSKKSAKSKDSSGGKSSKLAPTTGSGDLASKESQDGESAEQQQLAKMQKQFNSDASAFQPYRRPPDPFLNAPFEN